MTEPNATPTRADVLREITDTIEHGKCRCVECVSELLAEEVARLRAERAAMIRRVEALPTYDVKTSFGMSGAIMERTEDAEWLSRDAVLAALRDGGTDADA